MDPVANLERQRELAALLLERSGTLEFEYEETGVAMELAELVQDLDEWRRNGGFDPYLQDAPSVPYVDNKEGRIARDLGILPPRTTREAHEQAELIRFRRDWGDAPSFLQSPFRN